MPDEDHAHDERTSNRTDSGDDKLVGTTPDADAIDEPTTASEQATEETRWMLQQSLAVGLVSIAGGLLVAFGLLQATGLVELPGPLAGSALGHWAVFVALGLALLGAFAFSQWRT